MKSFYILKFVITFTPLIFLAEVQGSNKEKTCNIRVTNCHAASEPSASSSHFIACAYDHKDSVKAFAEDVESVPKGESKTVTCKNSDGKCDVYINGGPQLGDLTVAFCTGVLHVEVNDGCPGNIYVKADNNLFNLGIHTNLTGCGNFNF